MPNSAKSNWQRFQTAIAKAVDTFGGDRAAEERSGVSKTIWYDTKKGRSVPDDRVTWPAMREALDGLPVSHTGVRDWERLYAAVRLESGRGRRAPAPQKPRADSTPGSPHQLPPGTRNFTARSQEFAQLDEVLLHRTQGPAVPLAVVVGPPGVGKTALAVNWSHKAVEHFFDGVLYADLRGWSPDKPIAVEELLPEWLRVLGMNPATMPKDTANRSAALRTALADKQILIVLDNARSEEQVRPFLPGTPSCSVLVTGRQELPGLAIHHSAEMIRLGLLTVDESLSLMRQLVGIRVDNESTAAAALVEMGGRLPLALRVIAETARGRPSAPLSSFVAELADTQGRLDQLEGTDPRSDLRTVFSWSHSQLPGDVATLFRLLGLFPGRTFDLNAAAALGGTDMANRLRSLRRAHLIQASTATRFEMHDLIRLYANEVAIKTDSVDRVTDARQRLMDYFLHTAQRADELIVPHRYRMPLHENAAIPAPPFDDYDSALSWLDTECANLVALCRQDVPELDTRRWRLAFMLRGYFFLTKRLHEWVESHEGALAAAIRSDEGLGEAMTRSNLGIALHELGDDDAAQRHYEIAYQLFAQAGDGHGLSNTLANQAVIFRRRGEFDKSLRYNRKALAFYQTAGSRRYVAITLRSIALVEIELGRLAEAEHHLTESLDICRDLGMEMDEARSRNTLGQLLRLAGRSADARDAWREAIKVSTRCGSRYEGALALHGLGWIAADDGDTSQAEEHWCESLNVLEALGATKAIEVQADLAGLLGHDED